MPTSAKSLKAQSSNTPPDSPGASTLFSCWNQPPVTAAGSPLRDRGLDGALGLRLPRRACARTKHRVIGSQSADTDRRSLEAYQPRLPTEATNSLTDTHQHNLF